MLAPGPAGFKGISFCVASLNTGSVFATSPCGARTTIEDIILNLNVLGGEKEDDFGQLKEEGRHPLTSQMEIYCVGL